MVDAIVSAIDKLKQIHSVDSVLWHDHAEEGFVFEIIHNFYNISMIKSVVQVGYYA